MHNFTEVLRNTFAQMASIAVVAIFVQNILFTRAMDTSAALFIIRKKYNLLLFGSILTCITTLASILVYFADDFIKKFGWDAYSWSPFIYVLIVGLIYILFLLGCAKLPEKYNRQIVPMIHLSAFNGAVFGALLLSRDYTIWEHIAFGLGTGLGFMLASYLVEIGYERLSSDKIPPAFRGFPVTLIYIGILSLAFYGLIGHELSI